MRKTLNVVAIEAALAERGWTQKELAAQVEKSPQAVTNWLRGEDFPRPATLLKLAASLGLPHDRLVCVVDPGRPVIAFRKKAGAKTTPAHVARAEAIGRLLRPLVACLPAPKALRTLIAAPSTDYHRLQAAVAETRARLGLGERAVLEYGHLVAEFASGGGVLVPVLWNARGNHENAMHIRLPAEEVTFVYLNLDTRLEDFMFWMAHELAHVYTPDLAGSNEGEDFADAFAGALLYPHACAEAAYAEARRSTAPLRVLSKHAARHAISLNTVYRQVGAYAKAAGHTPLPIAERSVHAVRNSAPEALVSTLLFGDVAPEPERYIAVAEREFRTPFFAALRRLVREHGTGAVYLQQVLDTPLRDAVALHEALLR